VRAPASLALRAEQVVTLCGATQSDTSAAAFHYSICLRALPGISLACDTRLPPVPLRSVDTEHWIYGLATARTGLPMTRQVFFRSPSLQGRGALSQFGGRFDTTGSNRQTMDGIQEEVPESLQGNVLPDAASGIITATTRRIGVRRFTSMPFIFVFRGCSHAASIASLGPPTRILGSRRGDGFETNFIQSERRQAARGKLSKPRATLAADLARHQNRWLPAVERRSESTRSILEVLHAPEPPYPSSRKSAR